jgi:hypothetical protein
MGRGTLFDILVKQSTPYPSTSSVVINMSNKVPPPRQPVLWLSICRTKYLLPVNQFCSHQYVEQSISSPSTSFVVINMSTEMVDGEVVLCSTYWWLQNWLTGRGYFVRHIDDYKTGWRGGDTLFDILMTTELIEHQYVEQSTPSPSTSSVVINMSNKVPPLRQPVL